ncbi:MAG: bifunctional DNA primase/polymerase [Bryobacterales bacterium]|nr:bifunctional DNA primase/polymerase [Bryobacterales bacterium]
MNAGVGSAPQIELLSQAQELLKQGVCLIPTKSDKRPAIAWKRFQTDYPTEEQIAQWAKQFRPPAWAVVAGRGRCIILDFDGDVGMATMNSLGLDPHVATPTGGFHVYLSHPGWPVQTLNHKASKDRPWALKWPGLDIRADGGYALLLGRSDKGAYRILRPIVPPDSLDVLPADLRGALGLLYPPSRRMESPMQTSGLRDARVDAQLLINRAVERAASEGRNNAGFWLACQARDNGFSASDHWIILDYCLRTGPFNSKGKREPYAEQEALASWREAFRSNPRISWPLQGASTTAIDGNTEQPSDDGRFLWNDSGNADRLIARYGEDLIYCGERKSFMVWTGYHWAVDEFVRVERMAEETLRSSYREAGDIDQEDKRKAFLNFLNRSLSRAGIANMVHSAKRKAEQASINDFDQNPHLLNCRNRTVDLRTGTARDHRRADRITKLIPFDYDPDADCPLFKATIFRMMGGGPDYKDSENDRAERLCNYLQLAVGCAATGKPEKVIFILYGEGNNGKTTLLETWREALGNHQYAGEVQIETLMAKPKEAAASNAINADLADLKGCRFVSSSEVEHGHRLALARVKYLTGLGQLRARYLNQNFFNFKPSHKLFLDCNHRPVISDPNDAVWNRVKMIPFGVSIPPDEIDTDLPNKLRAELPGILRWIVAGAVEYLKHGLRDIEEVRAATEQYRAESDRLKEYLDDNCVIGKPKDFVKLAEIWQSYQRWTEQVGEKYPLSKAVFDERLQRLGCVKRRDRTGASRVWYGIRFITDKEKQQAAEGRAETATDNLTTSDTKSLYLSELPASRSPS